MIAFSPNTERRHHFNVEEVRFNFVDRAGENGDRRGEKRKGGRVKLPTARICSERRDGGEFVQV